MKIKALLLPVAVLLFGLTSCKKSTDQALKPVEGKWYEVKLTMYQTDGTGARLYDTTYLKPFTGYDFAQFNAKGTAVSGADHYYYLNMPAQANATQQITPITSSWNYTSIGSKYVLSVQSRLVNPGGFVSTDTVSIIHADTLLWHSVFYAHDGIHQTITDSYFVK